MKTTVVSGLLGAGKTTFIRRLLEGRSERAVVLVNDFGQAGIDGEVLTADGIESIELPSGCVCCTLKFDLITSIKRAVAEFSPDHLVIEPSGVASPSAVLEALESAGTGSASVIGLVDAAEFAELYESGMYGGFFQDQIENADVLLLNKTDLATETAVAAAEALIAAINPLAVLVRTVKAELAAPLPEAPARREIRPSGCHLHFDTLSFRLGPQVDLETFKRMFDALAAGAWGSVARAKAIINTAYGPFRFDSVFGRVDVHRFGRAVQESRLVVIGEGLDREGMKNSFA